MADPSDFTRRRGQIKLREEMGGEPAFFGLINRGLYGIPLRGKPASEVEGTKARQRQEMEDIQSAVKRPGRDGPDPISRSVAAPDVALPHGTAGKHTDGSFFKHSPKAAHGSDRVPPKEGPYPAPAKGAHGYGHAPDHRSGHMRVSGDPRAHRIGKR